ncbi:MAG TPA: alkaline phosphatase family protein [Longimicrobiales bacterium]
MDTPLLAAEPARRADPSAPPSRPAGRLRRLRRALYRLYYGIKYLPFAAERRARREDSRRGFVVIQIDALAHEDLVRAIEGGYMPHVQRLIRREGWTLRRFPAGLPSATPAAQAAIFYGTKDRIPGFRFYEKKQRRVVIGSQRPAMQLIRSRLPDDGVLAGGSSYVNLFDGGAARAVFTLAAREPQTLFENLGGTRLLLLLLLHPLRVMRMVLASIWEYLREERDRFISQLRGRYTYYWWYLPLLHIGSNVILRELQTLAVLLDIYTGVPAIYTTYNAYDELAHHFGPSSRTAFKGLRALDRRIAEIMRMLRRFPGRPYDLYILSDHGQTPSVPYRIRYGETLGDTIVAAARHGVYVLAETGDYGPPRETLDFLIRELEEVAATSREPGRRLGLRLLRWFRKQYGIFPLVAETVRVEESHRLVITYSSSLAHLYWTEPDRPLTFDEIRADPERRALYYFLVAHRGIGLVVTRLLDGAHVEGALGRALITPDGQVELLAGVDPLGPYAPGPIERRALVHLVQLENAGDIVLIGAYDPERDVCVCFDDQIGAHGALGGRQFWPFLLTPPGLVPDDHPIEDPLDLYPLLRRYAARQS